MEALLTLNPNPNRHRLQKTTTRAVRMVAVAKKRKDSSSRLCNRQSHASAPAGYWYCRSDNMGNQHQRCTKNANKYKPASKVDTTPQTPEPLNPKPTKVC